MSEVDDALERAERIDPYQAGEGGWDAASRDAVLLAAEVRRLREVESKVAEIATKMQAIVDDYWASR